MFVLNINKGGQIMNKTGKIVLALTLAVMLAVGCYFGVAASDEDDTGRVETVQMA
jgi:hypothetical protein